MTVRPTCVTLDNDGTDADRPPVLPFLHMWTTPESDSRIDLSYMTGAGLKSVGGGTSPQWRKA